MNTPPQRRTITFVIRLWAEYLEQNPPCWRGEIEQIDKAETHYFTDLAGIEAVVRGSLKPEPVPPAGCRPVAGSDKKAGQKRKASEKWT